MTEEEPPFHLNPVDSHIPCPVGPKGKYKFDEILPGHSRFYDQKDADKRGGIQSRAHAYAKRNGFIFRTRAYQTGVRVWNTGPVPVEKAEE